MNFSLLRVDKQNKLKSLSKNKINFFKKEEDISLFHFNKIDSDLYHAVFNISDEYQVGTKKLGNQHNYTYSSLVNLFFTLKHSYVFLEYINKEYQKEVIEELMSRTKTVIDIELLNNDKIKKVYKDLNGSIKKINYSNEDGELFNQNFMTTVQFDDIIDNFIIDDVTLLVEDQFITLSSNGKISVDNSDQDYLINFTKRILNAIS